MKKILIILAAIIAPFVILGVGSYVRCEILTARYGQEFSELYKQTNMINKVDYLKVIEYSENNAQVYYVTKNSFGNMITFVKRNNTWDIENWETMWSKSGTAEKFVLPYIR